MLINGLVLGVSEVSDGSAKSAIDQVLTTIIEVATTLGLPGANQINWKAIKTAMSDNINTNFIQQAIGGENS